MRTLRRERSPLRMTAVVVWTLLAAGVALFAGCTDTTAPDVGATGEWAGDVVNLTADGQPTQILSGFKPLAVELHLLEDTRGIRGVILSTLIEDQALKGTRDGDRLVLVAGNQHAVLYVNQHGDEMSGTLTVIFEVGGTSTIQRVYRVRLRR